MSSIAKIKANNTEYDVVGLGVENVKNDSFIGTWQGTQQEWEQAEITDWRKWQTDTTVGTGTVTSSVNITSMFFDGEKFYGFDSNFHWKSSTDGSTWTDEGATVDAPSQNSNNSCLGVYNKGVFFAASNSGVYKSTNGINWTLCCSTSYPRKIFANDDLIIVSKQAQEFNYSTDNGETWQTANWPVHPGSSTVPDIAYNGSIYVATGRNFMYTSTNGINWSYTSGGTGSPYCPLAYGNGRFVYNKDSNFYYSTDGTNWTVVSNAISSYCRFLIFAKGAFFAATDTYNQKLIASSDGVTWNTGLIGDDYSDWYWGVGGNNKLIATSTSSGKMAICPISSSTCYTTTTTPTTASTVYSAPNTASALTITSVGTGTITLSDSQVYNRQAAGDTQTYQDVASLYPNHLAFVDNVGVKIGNTWIADKTDTTEIEQDVENLESGKADVDLSNVSNTGTTKIAHNALPSNAYDDLTLVASNAYYTATSDGYVFVSKNAQGSGQYVNVYVVPSDSYERIVGFAKYSFSSGGIVLAGTVPVSKGQRFTVIYNASGSTNYFRFIYANGSAWEKA